MGIISKANEYVLKLQGDIIGTIDPPSGVPTDTSAVTDLIRTILTAVFSIAGVVAMAYMVVGGYKMVMSSGDPQRFKEGIDTLTYAIIGLIVTVSTGLIFNFVARLLGVEDLITVLRLP